MEGVWQLSRYKKRSGHMIHSKALATVIFAGLACTVFPAVAQSIATSPQFGSTSPLVDTWTKKFAAQIIGQQEYPRSAQVRGAEGTVRIRVQVAADGSVLGTELIQKSEHDVLNREALKTIQRAAPFPAPPGGARTIIVPLVWKLEK
jgi:periplasmic protein TonB